jgi:plasmid stabilization system protein ParE
MRVSLSNEALADFEEATDWYLGELAFSAADDFADAVEQALTLLRRFPEMGTPGRTKARALSLTKFPYSLIYRVNADHVSVIAIAHHSRRPGYWSGRR